MQYCWISYNEGKVNIRLASSEKQLLELAKRYGFTDKDVVHPLGQPIFKPFQLGTVA